MIHMYILQFCFHSLCPSVCSEFVQCGIYCARHVFNCVYWEWYDLVYPPPNTLQGLPHLLVLQSATWVEGRPPNCPPFGSQSSHHKLKRLTSRNQWVCRTLQWSTCIWACTYVCRCSEWVVCGCAMFVWVGECMCEDVYVRCVHTRSINMSFSYIYIF